MSSALLFAAIVALWAGALVPFWLRRDAAREEYAGAWDPSCQPDMAVAEETMTETGPSRGGRAFQAGNLAPAGGPPAFSVEGPAAAGKEPGMRGGGTTVHGGEHGSFMSTQGLPAVPLPLVAGFAAEKLPAAGAPRVSAPGSSAPRDGQGRERGSRDHAGTRPQRGSPRPGGARPGRYREAGRARVMAARRRMLMMLAALTCLAVAFALFRVASWWVVAVPALLLLASLRLLREASRMDAERRQSHLPAPAPAAAPAHVPHAGEAEDPLPDVEYGVVADIDAAVIPGPADGEPYDQYTDAKLRAVGD